METLLYILFTIICALLILLILIQQGKGAGVGFSMGGASQAMFGGSGGRDVFIKVTAGLAVAFGVICIVLARMAVSDAQGYHGVLANVPAPAPASAPASGVPGLPGVPASGPSSQPVAPMPLAPIKAAPLPASPIQSVPASAPASKPGH